MMGITEMIMQGAGKGYHPPNRANCSSALYLVAQALVSKLHQQENYHQAK